MPIVKSRTLETYEFNICQLVLIRRLLVLLLPNMGHVAPIVCTIRDIGGVRGVVDETIDSRRAEYVGQVVDHCLTGWIPSKVNSSLAMTSEGGASHDEAGFRV